MTRIALVPGVLALLPEYASIEDPVPEVRAAALAAVEWLGREVLVLADDQGRRVAAHLLAETTREGAEASYLVVGNGSAKTTNAAPGYLDARAARFDAELGERLRAGRFEADPVLAEELWASVPGIVAMGEELAGLDLVAGPATVDYDGDPYGVHYWVMRWQCNS